MTLDVSTPNTGDREYYGWRGWKLRPHGTRARYNQGCSCIPCCDANAEYMRDYRAKRSMKNTSPELQS